MTFKSTHKIVQEHPFEDPSTEFALDITILPPPKPRAKKPRENLPNFLKVDTDLTLALLGTIVRVEKPTYPIFDRYKKEEHDPPLPTDLVLDDQFGENDFMPFSPSTPHVPVRLYISKYVQPIPVIAFIDTSSTSQSLSSSFPNVRSPVLVYEPAFHKIFGNWMEYIVKASCTTDCHCWDQIQAAIQGIRRVSQILFQSVL